MKEEEFFDIVKILSTALSTINYESKEQKRAIGRGAYYVAYTLINISETNNIPYTKFISDMFVNFNPDDQYAEIKILLDTELYLIAEIHLLTDENNIVENQPQQNVIDDLTKDGLRGVCARFEFKETNDSELIKQDIDQEKTILLPKIKKILNQISTESFVIN